MKLSNEKRSEFSPSGNPTILIYRWEDFKHIVKTRFSPKEEGNYWVIEVNTVDDYVPVLIADQIASFLNDKRPSDSLRIKDRVWYVFKESINS